VAKEKKRGIYLNNPNLPTVDAQFEYTPEMVQEIKKCEENVLYFAENYFYIISIDEGKQKIKLHTYQRRALRMMRDNRFSLMLFSRQTGKALALDTPVPIPGGWTTMGDLKAGDKVYANDGSVCTVTHAHEVLYNRECFEVIFDNGEKIVADGDHQWFTQTAYERDKKINGSVKTTKQVATTIHKLYSEEPNHRILMSLNGVEGIHQDLPIHPYILGMWLGDGTSATGSITSGVRDVEETLNILKEIGQFDKIIVKKYGCTSATTLRLTCKKNRNIKSLSAVLRKNNLLNNKHIPVQYMHASRQQRLELLQGLMDSDGYISKGGAADFTNSNIKLVDQVRELVESLGYKVTYGTGVAKFNGKSHKPFAKINFKPREAVCKLSFKARRIVCEQRENSALRNRWHYIKAVVPIKSVPVRCITVDSPDHLFLVGKQYIPTHNSTISTIFCLWTACFNNDQNILLVANKESTAKEIFKRIRLAFEELPNWMKPGVKEYGKESMELANGSRIGITTTTGTAGRGSSANLLFIDEADWIECVAADTKITLRRKNTNTSYQMTIKNASEQIVFDEFQILTHTGWKNFDSIKHYYEREACTLKFDDGTTLTCSVDHELLTTNNEFIKASSSRGKKIATTNASKKVAGVVKMLEKIDLYDVINVDGGTYLTNDVVSHNCNLLDDFWASVYPIISSSKKSKIIMASTPRDTSGLFYRLYDGSTKQENNWAHMKIIWNEVPGRDEKWKRDTMSSLSDPTVFYREFECRFDETGESAAPQAIYEKLKRRCVEPQYVYMDGTYKVWHTPHPDHIYVVGVDVAEGVGKDYTVAHVLDVTDLRQINQVAMYACNTIAPTEFTPKLNEILRQWGNPLLLSERNNCGAQIVDNLRKDFGYENIVSYGARELGRTKIPLGIISHSNTKYDCIANKRYWINAVDAVQINDISTVEELKDFIRMPNGSWKARAGKHDDRVMALGWGLLILSDKIVHKHFEVVTLDENHKPQAIRPLDYGVKYFMNPTSMYVNERDGEHLDALPTMMGWGGQGADVDDLRSMGWEFL
jgi:hypothetical protein